MNIRFGSAALAIALSVAASSVSAATNVALSSDGASFVAASSYTQYAIGGCCGGPVNGGLSTMQNDVITNTPTNWLANGDTRYIFGHGDQNQWLEINLGSLKTLASFGATFDAADRAVIGPFYVETSTNGSTWTQQGSTLFNPTSGSDLINLAIPVGAQYVTYYFGPTSPQYGGDGSGVSQVFANAIPEPAIWAMMLIGFFTIGAVMRRTSYERALPTA